MNLSNIHSHTYPPPLRTLFNYGLCFPKCSEAYLVPSSSFPLYLLSILPCPSRLSSDVTTMRLVASVCFNTYHFHSSAEFFQTSIIICISFIRICKLCKSWMQWLCVPYFCFFPTTWNIVGSSIIVNWIKPFRVFIWPLQCVRQWASAWDERWNKQRPCPQRFKCLVLYCNMTIKWCVYQIICRYHHLNAEVLWKVLPGCLALPPNLPVESRCLPGPEITSGQRKWIHREN